MFMIMPVRKADQQVENLIRTEIGWAKVAKHPWGKLLYKTNQYNKLGMVQNIHFLKETQRQRNNEDQEEASDFCHWTVFLLKRMIIIVNFYRSRIHS